MTRSFSLALTAVLIAVTSAHAQVETKFLGKRVDEWARQLRTDADPAQRRNAAFALGKMHADGALDDLKTTLAKEKNPRVRDAIVFALGDISRDSLRAGNDAALEAQLCALLQARDEDPLVRRSAAYAIGCLRSASPQAHAALETGLGAEEGIVRQSVAWALGQIGEEALQALGKALRDADPLVQRDAASALLQMRDGNKVHTLVADLLPLCRADNSEVRRAAVNVLVRVVDRDDKRCVAPLREVLADKDVEIRRNAALALSNIGGAEVAAAVPVLREALSSDDIDLRQQSAVGLGNIGPEAGAAVPDLLKILQAESDDPRLRGFAALSLGGVGIASDDVVGALADRIAASGDTGDVRADCATALNYLGVRNADATARAIPRLLGVLKDPRQDVKVRARIIWALRPHARILPSTRDAFSSFTDIIGEPRNGLNSMLRYDAAYMLGMVWTAKAPDQALDVLSEFLRDDGIKLFDGKNSQVTGSGAETSSGTANVMEIGKGDGRTMACDALKMIGRERYGSRKDILQQLRVLAADTKIDPALRKKAAELQAK